MSTISAFEKEILLQLDYLKNFIPQKMLSPDKQKKAIFCGTGDSFASAQLGEIFSHFRARAHDPLDLIKNKNLIRGHQLFLVSISGNTVSNIRLANLSKRTVAITANLASRLAKACQKVISLRFDSTGIQTSGSISFLASALTCISLVSRYEIRQTMKIFEYAKKISKRISIHGKVYVLGNLYTMPVTFFCAAKLHEVLGINAHYEKIEQFFHAGIFSAKVGDTVILFEEKNLHNEKLLKHLKRCGLVPIRISPPKTNLLGEILFFIFVSEFIALYTAKKKRKKECYFVQARQLKNASSSMIY